MVEPHYFCGPEFILEFPEPRSNPELEPELLLRLQGELYNLLSPDVRRRMLCSAAGIPLPPPPDHILFVETQPLGDASEVRDALLFLITDSRAAAEVFTIGLRNAFIALPNRMRLRNRYTGALARLTPTEILRRREALLGRMNFDEDLWALMEAAITPEWLREWESQQTTGHEERQTTPSSAGPMRESQRHTQRVESVICYCERAVKYIGVMDEDGGASPFLMAIGLFFHFRLTHRDALLHLVRHPRRTVRALALFVARYTVAPEELEAFFAPSIPDAVVIACTEDQQLTTSMQQLCEDLLLRDEVYEAWPPTYHARWVETVVRPMMERVGAEWRRREEMRNTREEIPTAHTPNDLNPNGEAHRRSGGEEGKSVRGSGQGVGVFGFRRIGELQSYVAKRERALVPQRVLAMLGPRLAHAGGSTFGNEKIINNALDHVDDDQDGEEEEEEDFLIKVRVERSGDGVRAPNNTMGMPNMGTTTTSRGGVTAKTASGVVGGRKRRREETAALARGTRALVITEAYRVVMRLLGRTDPFNARSEHYLRF